MVGSLPHRQSVPNRSRGAGLRKTIRLRHSRSRHQGTRATVPRPHAFRKGPRRSALRQHHQPYGSREEDSNIFNAHMTCKTHQFITVKRLEKFREGTMHLEKEGARVVCVNCGETRDIWEDGQVQKITHEKKTTSRSSPLSTGGR